MARLRTVSPRFLKQLSAGEVKVEPGTPETQVLSRLFWLGPQDLDSCPDFRLSQLLGFGLIDDVERALRILEERGWIVEPAIAAAEFGDGSIDHNEQQIETRARLAAIARLAESVGSDVSALGPESVRAAGGELSSRIRAVHEQLAAIASDLRAAREPYVADQVKKLGVAGKRDLKLHLGAGLTKLDGWVNSDVFPAELSLNLAWKLPFDDGSVAFAYAGHVFEHLYYGAEGLALLRELKRVLRPGGVFRFIVPDMSLFLRKYAEGDREFFEKWRTNSVGAGAKYFSTFTTPMELITSYCFVGRDPSEFFGHKMGYDFETIEKLARRAGFTKVTRGDYMTSEHPELRVDEVSAASRLMYNGERYSLFIEVSA